MGTISALQEWECNIFVYLGRNLIFMKHLSVIDVASGALTGLSVVSKVLLWKVME